MIVQLPADNLEHTLREALKIDSLANELKLQVRENIVRGDNIPGLISRTIWQSGIEVTRSCIDTFAHNESIALQKTPISLEFESFRKLIFRQTILDIHSRVLQILTREPTLYQKYTSRLGLNMQSAESLSSYDQDRIIASNLFLPYPIWVTLLNIFAQYEEFSEILQNKELNIIYTTSGGILLEISQGKNEKEIYFPNLPGAINQKVECDIIDIEKGGFINVYLQGGYKYTLEIPLTSVEHYGNMLMPEQNKQYIRAKVYEKIPNLVWKNRFGKGGNNPKKDIIPEGELSWQR